MATASSSSSTVSVPQFTDSVTYRYFIEPLNAPTSIVSSLKGYPDALYTTAPDSHFIRFMTALLGPVGVGWLKENMTIARLQLEATGLHQSDLEAFYGDPFSFAQILNESYDDDTSGLLPIGVLQSIRAQDEAYRSRAIQFLGAARLGGTPAGMQLVATSGVGQNCEIVENYRFLFDAHSDEPLGLLNYGSSPALGEFIVVPRPAVSTTQQQVLQFSLAAVPLGANHYTLSFNGSAVTLDPTTTGTGGAGQTAADVQTALWGLQSVGTGNAAVSGGPVPNDVIVTFTGLLSNQDLPTLSVQFTDASSEAVVPVPVETITGGVDPNSETVVIADIDRHSMQVALDYLRPVATYPTFAAARGTLRPQIWSNISATTQFSTVIRYVTGSPAVAWPPVDADHWIVAAEEIEAPQLTSDLPQHYVGFHNVNTVTAYTDQALSDPNYATTTAVLPSYNSVHVGPFPEMVGIMPSFAQYATAYNLVFSADFALADYTAPLNVSGFSQDGTPFINNIYPADYASLQGVPALQYNDNAFWSSQARPSGAEILEIDLGTAQAVNFLAFETTRKPISIAAAYDVIDQSPARRFAPVVGIPGFTNDTNLYYDPTQQSPWAYTELYFNDGLTTIFTRYIRLTFTRRADSTTYGRFLFDTQTQTQTPWSVDVRNLRIGRNVAPSVN